MEKSKNVARSWNPLGITGIEFAYLIFRKWENGFWKAINSETNISKSLRDIAADDGPTAKKLYQKLLFYIYIFVVPEMRHR